ncbi:AsmA family protein [Flavihumibacter rivuli]|uniref:AsmA family protein n=1 Tax=Flavihumibacter rivuli TaxID=2838156 RepID=UPI001BDE7836|nr:AsmA-like C-terminal region-containing protein [Flavihumibacter rivuli]ULQ57248.1 AsmA family protein [Flavihumibacter rivuli]
MMRMFLKILKYIGIGLVVFIAILFLLPVLFPGKVADNIKLWANQSIDGKLEFRKARLSFFSHFPTLTLTLYDFSLTGSKPFEKDTLLAGEALGFGLNLASLFSDRVTVDRFYVDKALINILVDENGAANYNIYKGKTETKAVAGADTSSTQMKIKGIFIADSRVRYNDQSLPMTIIADGFDYEGHGDMDRAEFELASNFHADSLDFSYDGTPYILRRRVEADLITGVNTSSLVFRFQKNNLMVNRLPVDFSGMMTILKDGYDIDLKVISGITDFGNIFSVLPPEYDPWFRETSFSGTSRITLDLKGGYRAGTGQAPDLLLALWVRNGMIRHKNAPKPLEQVHLAGTLSLPGLNVDSLVIRADTIAFGLDGSVTKARGVWKGLERPFIQLDLESKLDLGMLDQALGLSAVDMKGKLELQAKAEGVYELGQNPASFRPDTILISIPNYDFRATIGNGYLKFEELPLPLRDLGAGIQSACTNGRWQDIRLDVDRLNARVGDGSIQGNLKLEGLDRMRVDGQLNAALQMEDITRSLPLDGYEMGGRLDAIVKVNGQYDPKGKDFPVMDGKVKWQDGTLKTPWYPAALKQLNLDGGIASARGNYSDVAIRIQPLRFELDGQPFWMESTLTNLNDLTYDIKAKGVLDLGKIYQVFAVQDYSLKGLLEADLALAGRQSDAMAGRVRRLNNSGVLRFRDLELRSVAYPAPFLLSKGQLEFRQDKAWLRNCSLHYLQNQFLLNGYIRNIVGYWLQDGVLQGEFTLRSDKMVVDDFMAFSDSDSTSRQVYAEGSSGTVLIPHNLDLRLNSAIKQVEFGKSMISDFKSSMLMSNGKLLLDGAGFRIAGARVDLGASYIPAGPSRADFTFTLKADSFDVQRAYREVSLFREMASSAAKASGLVSVDYSLAGRLNAEMQPVYPSIKGKGVVTLEQVKVNGLKLFGAVSKATGKDSINNPNLKAVVIKSSIQNNIITIERTRMKVFGFRPRIEGQTSLDGRLNLKFRLGLPPFGLIGIPMTITGTADNPLVKVRKGRDEDKLEEVLDESGN